MTWSVKPTVNVIPTQRMENGDMTFLEGGC